MHAAHRDVEILLDGLAEYVILRNHNIRDNLARGGDVDLLVGDAGGAEKVLSRSLGSPLWMARRSYVRGYFYPWGHVDLLPRLEWHGAVYLNTYEVLEGAGKSHTGLPKPRLAHEALASWFSSLLWGGFFKMRYKPTILEAVREDGLTLRHALVQAAGHKWGERLWQAAAESRPEISAEWAKSVRRAVWWRAFRRDPGKTLLGWLAFWKAEIRLRLQPPVPWVAVLGPDGSGKSSLLEALKARLGPTFGETSIYHWRPGIIRSPDDADGPVIDPHGKPPRGWFASLLKLGFLFLDWTVGYWARLVHLRAKGRLVLFDRDYYDLLVDSRRYRYARPLWLARLMGKFIPRPNLFILLDAPPEVFHARKREVAFDEVARQRKRYLELARGLSNGHAVDASKSFEEVVAEVEEVILSHTASRTVRMSEPWWR